MTTFPGSAATRAAVTVVPIPDVSGSWIERSQIWRFASSMSATIPSALVGSAPSSSAAAARPAAISPARAPPMPSAIAKNGGLNTNASSFPMRRRPVSVTTAVRPILIGCLAADERGRVRGTGRFPPLSGRRGSEGETWFPLALLLANASRRRAFSFLKLELRLAHTDDVARLQHALRGHTRTVDERAVGRAQVLDPDAVRACLDSRVLRGCELVAVDRDAALGPPSDDRGGSHLDGAAPLEPRPVEHDESGCRRGVLGSQGRRLGSAEDDALLRRPAQVLRRAPHDQHDEAVQEHEEGQLEDEQRVVTGEREDAHGCEAESDGGCRTALLRPN